MLRSPQRQGAFGSSNGVDVFSSAPISTSPPERALSNKTSQNQPGLDGPLFRLLLSRSGSRHMDITEF